MASINATISATNSNSTANQALTITIAVGIPVITSAATATGWTGTAFNYQIVATNGPTSFGATGLPSGLTINATNGQISGTPTVDGVFPVNLSATNGTGTGTMALTLTIALTPPIIISPSSVTTKPGDSFHYELKALVGSPTYTATGLPAGLTLDPISGFITGMMTAGGRHVHGEYRRHQRGGLDQLRAARSRWATRSPRAGDCTVDVPVRDADAASCSR